MDSFSSKTTISSLFLQTIKKVLQQEDLLDQNRSFVVGCSLGPDSTALTIALLHLQKEIGFKLHAVYVDHGLRLESKTEGAQFLAWAQQHCLSAEVIQVAVKKQGSLMEAARNARYEALKHIVNAQNADALMVGHTLTDQGETFFIRLLSGSGIKGLSGMQKSRAFEKKSHVKLLRPLLSLTRTQILDFLQEQQASFVEDPTNQNQNYLRSRVRHVLFPILQKEQPNIDKHLDDLTQEIRNISDYLTQLSTETLSQLRQQGSFQQRSEGHILFKINELQKLHPALLSQILQIAIPVTISSQNVKQMISLCQTKQGTKQIQLPSNWYAKRVYQELHVYIDHPDLIKQPLLLEIHQPAQYSFGPWIITVQRQKITPHSFQNKFSFYGTLTQVQPPWILRSFKPGDRIQPSGMKGHRKVSDILVDAKVPRFERHLIPILCQEEKILWVAGYCHSQQDPFLDPYELHDVWLFTISPSTNHSLHTTCSNERTHITNLLQ